MSGLMALATVLLLGLVPALAAGAGGTWLHTLDDSYDPGDEVTAVAYVGTAVTDDPVLARMSVAPILPNGELAVSGWIELGPVTLEPTGLAGYLETRVSISFTLPEELEPGDYVIDVRTQSGGFFGDLMGTHVIVGAAAPSEPRWIEWALDDPLIEELPDSAVIAGPGFAVSVATLKAGNYPTGSDAFMLHPEDLPPITSTAVPPSVVEEPFVHPVVTTPSNEKPPAMTESADVDESDGVALGAPSPAPRPPQPITKESGRHSEDMSIIPGVAVAGGAMLVVLLAWMRRWPARRQATPVGPEESDRVLTGPCSREATREAPELVLESPSSQPRIQPLGQTGLPLERGRGRLDDIGPFFVGLDSEQDVTDLEPILDAPTDPAFSQLDDLDIHLRIESATTRLH